MINLEQLKIRTNNLIDELHRIEGAIKENQHLISWIEEYQKKAVEPIKSEFNEVPVEAIENK